MEKERFDIGGMTCSACAGHVGKAVSALEGVDDVNVNLLKNSMDVSFDPDKTTEQEIVAAVKKAGYSAVLHRQRP